MLGWVFWLASQLPLLGTGIELWWFTPPITDKSIDLDVNIKEGFQWHTVNNEVTTSALVTSFLNVADRIFN